MAIYKPNNFYPYQQEVDMESVEGNIFSCQTNTDGALTSGARVKILSAVDSYELYENVYQFKDDNVSRIYNADTQTYDLIETTVKSPYRNKEIIELPIMPYEVTDLIQYDNTNKTCILSGIQFQSLCGKNITYEIKSEMCPYNIYLVKKNQISYFVIKVGIDVYDENENYLKTDYYSINLNDITINSDKENLFNIIFNNADVFSNYESLIDNKFYKNLRYYITLKNNYDYLWNVRLYEHYFDEAIDTGTFVTDGYVTGSTKNVFWWDQNNNDNIIQLANNIKKDNYIEVVADENNSDIFKNQIDDGKVMSGELRYDLYSETKDAILEPTKHMLADKASDNIFNFYNYFKFDNVNNIINSNNNMNTWDNSYIGSSTTFTKSRTPTYITKWRILKNAKILSIDNDVFDIDFSKSSLGDYIYRAFDEKYNDFTEDLITDKQTMMNFYKACPFIVPDCKTHVIIKECNDEDVEEEHAKITNSMIYIINEKKYYVKVLSPLPPCSLYYNIESKAYGYHYEGGSKRYHYGVYVELTTEALNRFIAPDNDIDNINIDMICFQKSEDSPYKYNAIVDVFNNIPTNDNYSQPLILNKIYNINPIYHETLHNTYFLRTHKLLYISGNTYSEQYSHIDTMYANTYLYFPVNNKKFTIEGYIRSEGKFNNNLLNSYTFTYQLLKSSNILYEDNIIIDNFRSNDSINIDGETAYKFSIDITIPNVLNNSLECKITFPIVRSSSGDYLTDSVYFYDLKINYSNNEAVYYLSNNSVDCTEYLNNMYISFDFGNYVLFETNYDYLLNTPQKIKKYNIYNNIIILEDLEYFNKLSDFLSSFSEDNSEPPFIHYKLLYKKREKITWTTENIGIEQNINKIETENEFDVNLKDGTSIYLYPCSDQNTYNSFYGVKDPDLNVENIYIRFPEYSGKDALGNELSDGEGYYNEVNQTGTITYYEQSVTGGVSTYSSKTYSGVIKGPFYCSLSYYKNSNGTVGYFDDGTSVGCPVVLYGTKVSEDKFNIKDETNDNKISCKLFKVTSYNPDTGEFVFETGLERIVLNTDRYEIWKKEAIEGSNNRYDITEVINTYTRLYPQANNFDGEAIVSTGESLIPDGIRIMNSTDSRVFIQPNVNFTSDNNFNPFAIIDNTENKLRFQYNQLILNPNYNIKDITIDKLDGSQWLLNYSSDKVNDLTPGMTYRLYTDWSDSNPSSYFYGRDIGEIELKYGELSEVNKIRKSNSFSVLGYDDLRSELYDFDNRTVGDNCIITGMDIYLLANIKNIKAKIKKYRYKIYDSEMELLYDSLDIWDNIMEYELKGLNENEMYYLTFECEDEFGYKYFYETSFYSEYSILEVSNKNINLEALCSQNAIKITIDPIMFTSSEYNLSDIKTIMIYRKDSTGKTILVNVIDLFYDKIYVGIGDNDYHYGFVDYGVYNNEYYDYLFIFDKEVYTLQNSKSYKYILSNKSIKTQFDSWSIVNVVLNPETGFYEVNGDTWSFKYNLESSETTHNTSVTTWNTLGRYAQWGVGERGYDSSGLTCLLGDVGYYTVFDGTKDIEKYGYHEKLSTSPYDNLNLEYKKVKSNNIDKHKKWKKFCRSYQVKLLKDIAGNKWLVGIVENPSTKVADNSKEQLKTVSFQWMEVADSSDISVIGKLTSIDREQMKQNNIINILNNNWAVYSLSDDFTTYYMQTIKLSLNYDNFFIDSKIINNNELVNGVLITNHGISPFSDKYGNYSTIKSYEFDNNLVYTDKSIDNLFKGNTNIESIKITLGDNITSAKYAFAGCTNLTTDNDGYIEINTSNYIDTKGMLDNTEQPITIKWNDSLTNSAIDLLTYAELYEQYWNKDNIILDDLDSDGLHRIGFNLSEWDYISIEGEGSEDEVNYIGIIKLNNYINSKENIFVPKFINITDKEKINNEIKNGIYMIILNDGLKI